LRAAFLMTVAAVGQRLSREKARLKAPKISPILPKSSAACLRCSAIHVAAALRWEPVPRSNPACADLTAEALYMAEILMTLTSTEPEPKA
jgi:predicted RNA polymerase sigma factor